MNLDNISTKISNKIDLNNNPLDQHELFLKKLSFLNFEDHTFFSFLENNIADPLSTGKIMAPFYFAVANWVDHLRKVHQKIVENNNGALSNLVQENIKDEMGYQDSTIYPDKAHTVTFINFLHSLGFRDKLIMSDGVKKFNEQLAELFDKEITYHLSVLAGIEYFYTGISNLLSNYCRRRNILQEHYMLHGELDLVHSADFLKITKSYNCDKTDLVQGMATGYLLLWNVFDSLFDEYIRIIDELINK